VEYIENYENARKFLHEWRNRKEKGHAEKVLRELKK
jgi:peroxiredoxin